MRRATLALGLTLLAAFPAAAVAAPRVDLGVSFGEGARLGTGTSMNITVHVEAPLKPITEFRLLLPAGLELSSSDLGAITCRRPVAEIRHVLGPVVHDRCPGNSLMGTGSATAGLLLDDEFPLYGAGIVEIHSGVPVRDKPGLLVTVDTYNPARLQLTYEGYLYVPPPQFGVGLAILVPPIPEPPLGAPVALSTLRLAVGGRGIIYHRNVGGRRVAYHPGGIPLPATCPRGAFRFRVILHFAGDERNPRGERRASDAVVPCPPRR